MKKPICFNTFQGHDLAHSSRGPRQTLLGWWAQQVQAPPLNDVSETSSMPASSCFNSASSFCLHHHEEGLLSREVHSLLIVIIALFSVYIAGVCVIFTVLFRVSPMFSPWMLSQKLFSSVRLRNTWPSKHLVHIFKGLHLGGVCSHLSLHNWDCLLVRVHN